MLYKVKIIRYVNRIFFKICVVVFIVSFINFCETIENKITQYNFNQNEYGLFEAKVEIINNLEYIRSDPNVRITNIENKKFSDCLELSKLENLEFVKVSFISIKNIPIESISTEILSCNFLIRYDIVEFISDSRFKFNKKYPKYPKESYTNYFDGEFSMMKASRIPLQMRYSEYKNYEFFLLKNKWKKGKIRLLLVSGIELQYYIELGSEDRLAPLSR